MKEICNKCSYWTGEGHKYYKCYGGECPAKKPRTEEEIQQILQEVRGAMGRLDAPEDVAQRCLDMLEESMRNRGG